MTSRHAFEAACLNRAPRQQPVFSTPLPCKHYRHNLGLLHSRPAADKLPETFLA
jgi:hypothetical protein